MTIEWKENEKGNWVYSTPVATGIIFRKDEGWKGLISYADGKKKWGEKVFESSSDAMAAVQPHVPTTIERKSTSPITVCDDVYVL